MKALSLIPLTAWLSALPVYAIEAPPDDAPPPAEVGQPAAEAPAEKSDIAYLGVVSATVPEMLADHLNLKVGEGIVVRALMPDGPAAKAGLVVNDVITSVAGKPVGTSDELTARIAAQKPGDTVRLDVIHRGKSAGVDIVLGHRPARAEAPALGALDELNLDGVPKDLADRVKRMIEGNLGELKFDLEQGVEEAAPQIEDAMREMRERMGQAMRGMKIPDIGQQGGVEIHQGATFRLMDEQGSLELKAKDGGKEITVRDRDQNITWTGPWDTEQDKAAAPEDVRRRVERLDFDSGANGLRFRLRDPK